MSMMSGFRALDLTDEKGFFCGKILGDLGIEVIKVEVPGGDPARNIGPFINDQPNPEMSLYWFAYNTNKKSITLDLETTEGQEVFKEMAQKVDFIIESFPRDKLDKLNIGYDCISKLNPGIVFTSITPFGQDGPYRDYQTSDLVSMALGGYLYLCGDPDRAPLRISFPQAYAIAGAEAAAASLIAHYYRQISGEGQRIDISIQHAVSISITNTIPSWELNQAILKRNGQFRIGLSQANLKQRQVWRCKDGWVLYLITGGAMRARAQQALINWIDEEGLADESVRNMDWKDIDMSTISQETIDIVESCLGNFFQAHTKMELQEGALKRRIDIYAVCTIEDIVKSEQLKSRDFWQTVEYPAIGISAKYPGSFVKSSETPLCPLREAPQIGEHNREIYSQWLGKSDDDILLLKENGII